MFATCRRLAWGGILAAALCSLSCGGKITTPQAHVQAAVVVYSVRTGAPGAGTGLGPDSLEADTLWTSLLDGTQARSLGIAGVCPSWVHSNDEISYYAPHPSTWLGWWRLFAARPGETPRLLCTHEALWQAAWRPDGGQFLLENAHAPDGSTVRLPITQPQVFGTDTISIGDLYEWAGDAVHVLAQGLRRQGGFTGDFDYFLLDTRTGLVSDRLTRLRLREAVAPALSPDRTKLVFCVGEPGPFGLRVVDLASQAVTQITDGWDESAHWGPDSRTIIFTRLDDSTRSGYHIYRTSLDAPGVVTRTSDRPVWPGVIDVRWE